MGPRHRNPRAAHREARPLPDGGDHAPFRAAGPYSVLFVVPGPGRVETLRQAYRDMQRARPAQRSTPEPDALAALVAAATDLHEAVRLGVSGGRSTPLAARGRSRSASCRSHRAGSLSSWKAHWAGAGARTPLASGAASHPSVSTRHPRRGSPLSGVGSAGGSVDLPPAGIDGSMDDPDPHNEDEEVVASW